MPSATQSKQSKFDDVLINSEELARQLRVTPEWVRRMRQQGNGPPFQVLPTKAIRYGQADVLQWLNERSYRSIEEYREKAPFKSASKRNRRARK